MRAAQMGVAVSSAVMVASCATEWDRSYDRWYAYEAAGNGPYGRWAHCVSRRSAHHLTREPSQRPDMAEEPVSGNHSQLFTHVLADCREFMSGREWDDLDPDDLARLIADAYREFHRVHVDIQAQAAVGIISESQN